jgi:hypothetical protein
VSIWAEFDDEEEQEEEAILERRDVESYLWVTKGIFDRIAGRRFRDVLGVRESLSGVDMDVDGESWI